MKTYDAFKAGFNLALLAACYGHKDIKSAEIYFNYVSQDKGYLDYLLTLDEKRLAKG